MIHRLHAFACRDVGEARQTLGKGGPLHLVEAVTIIVTKAKSGGALPVDAMRAFGHNHHPHAEGAQQVDVSAESLLLLTPWPRGEMAAVPTAYQPQAVAAERGGEFWSSERIGVTQFGAGVTGLAHFAEDAVERQVAG